LQSDRVTNSKQPLETAVICYKHRDDAVAGEKCNERGLMDHMDIAKNIPASVVIPSGRPDSARHIAMQLLKSMTESFSYEVIVVTPSPDRLSGIQHGRLRVVGVDRLYPPGKMRNIGFDQARGEFVLFIDDDCEPSKNWVRDMIRILTRNQRIGAVGCRVAGAGSGFWERCADYALFGVYQYPDAGYRDIGSAAMAVRREAFEMVAGFDETLYASEDWDFNLRLQEKGWRRFFDPTLMVVHHHGRGEPKAIGRQAYHSGRQSGLFVQSTHFGEISSLARLSVRMGTPWYYPFLILPYALAVTVLQWMELKGNENKIGKVIPLVFLAKCIYHFGVWFRLLSDYGKMNPNCTD